MVYKISMFGDTHLGYSTRCRTHPQSGLNMRVRDGFLGLRETVDQILAADVDLVLHGGDLFHRSHPAIAEISWARRQLERLTDAGIQVICATGNHDYANDRGKAPATAAAHDPGRGIHMVTDPYQVFTPADGLNVHVLSHVGLLATERIIPTPVEGEANILLSHGAAQIPGHEIFATVDSPGEAVIGYDVLTAGWSAVLLGHYHGMGPLPGFDSGPTGQVWYAGSLLRRGFSDPAGGRGWLEVTIDDSGAVSIEPRYIRQRPQFDLPVIDATGQTAVEVEAAIRENLTGIDIPEAIIRQRVINCPLPVRRGIDMAAITELAAPALVWQLDITRPADLDFAAPTALDAAVGSLSTAGSSDLPGMFSGWFSDYAERADVAAELRPVVIESGSRLLRQVSGEPADPAPAAPQTPTSEETAA